MTAAEAVWAASLVTAVVALPVGAIRMLAYRSGGVDHTRGMYGVALLALGLGAVALVVLVGMTLWCGTSCTPG